METADILKKVRAIELKTRGISNHMFAGEYHSAFKGRGMSFSEVRDYQYGDDIRNIDWNVTARYKKPFVKVFEEERELTMMLLVDISGSAFFGSGKQFKNEIITEICAVLAFSAIKNNDKVGVIFFSDQVELFIPPKKGKSHILRIIRELIHIEPKSTKTNIDEALKYFNNIVKKRSIAFILSDFMDKSFKETLSITSRRHDISGIHIYDKNEEELPNVGLARLIDAESGDIKWVDTSSKLVRDRFNQKFAYNRKLMRDDFLKSGSDLTSIAVHESYIQALRKFFKKREMRS